MGRTITGQKCVRTGDEGKGLPFCGAQMELGAAEALLAAMWDSLRVASQSKGSRSKGESRTASHSHLLHSNPCMGCGGRGG